MPVGLRSRRDPTTRPVSLSKLPSLASPFKRKQSVRRFIDQLLLVELIRKVYLRIRFFWLVYVRRRLRVYSEQSEDIASMTIRHNLKGLRDVAAARSNAIVRPMSMIESLGVDARILCIGPRTEGELYNIVAHGFRLKNIEGLDLISYSPHISVGDMHAMPYEDASWDAIVAGFVIAYSDRKRKAAMEMVRVCKPGGVIGVGVEWLMNLVRLDVGIGLLDGGVQVTIDVTRGWWPLL